MISKVSYRQVVKNLDHFRKQHMQDRQENPGAMPCAWGSAIRMMIESTIKQNHERYSKDTANNVLEYLVSKNLLIRYVGDYTFPSDETLPTKNEITKRTLAFLEG